MGNEIWLEVANVRIERANGKDTCKIQFKGERGDKEATWWPIEDNPPSTTHQEISKGLDSGKLVTANLECEHEPAKGESFLRSTRYRVQQPDRRQS